jgi:hypothetical protein
MTWWHKFIHITTLSASEMADLLPGLDMFRERERENDVGKSRELADAIGRLMRYASLSTARVERLRRELSRARAEIARLRLQEGEFRRGYAPVLQAMAEGAGAVKH